MEGRRRSQQEEELEGRRRNKRENPLQHGLIFFLCIFLPLYEVSTYERLAKNNPFLQRPNLSYSLRYKHPTNQDGEK
jgi:hypothetical protein